MTMPLSSEPSETQPPAKFLSAEWRYLAMLNYEIDPACLLAYVPNGTELDSWNGKTFVSVVGFLFLKTKVMGWSIPFHTNFEEVNLRFYVRRLGPEGWRRGVVFIKEIVPKPAIAAVARLIYNENYVAMPMRHEVTANFAPPALEVQRKMESIRGEHHWRFAPAPPWFTRGIYHRTLLGLCGPKRWRLC